jgi:hypothetical protein
MKRSSLGRATRAVVAAAFFATSLTVIELATAIDPSSAYANVVAHTQHTIPGWNNTKSGLQIDALCAPSPAYSCTSSSFNALASASYDPLVSGEGLPGAPSAGCGTPTVSDWAWCEYGPSFASQNNYGYHNCTLYVAYLLGLEGVQLSWSDNATSWATDAANNGSGTVNQQPAIGAVAQWNAGQGHVAFVTNYVPATQGHRGYITTTADNFSSSSSHDDGYTDAFKIYIGSIYWPDNFIHFKDLYSNNTIVRQSSGRAWVVQNGTARAIQSGVTYHCAEFRAHLPVVNIGSYDPTVDLPLGQPYACSFNGSVLFVQQDEWLYWFGGGKAHPIAGLANQNPPDVGYSISYYSSSYPVVTIPSSAMLNSLGVGGYAPLRVRPQDLPGNSIIQVGSSYQQGASWVVRNAQKQLIP